MPPLWSKSTSSSIGRQRRESSAPLREVAPRPTLPFLRGICLFFLFTEEAGVFLRTSHRSRSAMLARGVAFASPVIAYALIFSGVCLVDHRCMCSDKSL